MKIRSYKEAGVDIDGGDAFADYIRNIPSSAVSKGIGGFAGGTEIDLSRYKEPVLFSTTDGVGTKLLVAKELRKYDTIGIDLVAMCVNDLIVSGVQPLTFLDYIACGGINTAILNQIIAGIVKGCEEAQCILSGGETAEMPDIYGKDDIDLAGFCTGIGEKSRLLPKTREIQKGDLIFGIPSSGIHSNGLSLARKVVPVQSPHYRELLVPTKIYVKEINALLKTETVLGAAHITGGGLPGNISRVLPDGTVPKLRWDWPVPDIFQAIEKEGKIPEEEMQRVFNMGIGAAFIVHSEDSEKLVSKAAKEGIILYPIGEVTIG